MSSIKREYGTRKMGAGRQPGAAALDRLTINTVVRRLGDVADKALQSMMSNLIANDEHGLAEALNDSLKPAVDYLLHFDVREEITEVDGGP